MYIRKISRKNEPIIDHVHESREINYRIYSNKRRGAYLLFRATSAALIRRRRLIKHCTRQIYSFYIFIQRYAFYLLIFQWTDTKLIVNLELRANSFVVVEQFKENKLPMLF